ncbi:MAG TPA: hypothetical protein PK156_25800 [Polyangium sp.]|nr:hypothetical protein [Polyangium sp.]
MKYRFFEQQTDVSSQDGHAAKFLLVVQRERDRFRCAMGAAVRLPAKFRLIGCFLVLAFALFVGGCAGPAFSGSVYRGQGYAFRVPQPPASWKQIDVDGKALSFVDESNGAIVAASGRCKVDGEDVPLRSLVQHLFLQFTEREVISEETVPFDGREALHTVVVAKLDGVPKQFDVWVLKKDGCVYDLYLIVDPAEFNDAVGPFRQFVQGFATVRADDD